MSDFLTFMHILFVTLLIFNIGALNYSAFKLYKTQDVHEFGVFLRLGKTAGMMSPLAIIPTVIFGVLAANEIGYSLTDGWLVAAYIAVAVALVVPPLTLKKWGQAAGMMMPQAMQEGRILPEQKAQVASVKHTAVEVFMNGLLVFILVDMVYKF